MCLLIVEDHEDFRFLLVRSLRQIGFTVVEAADAYQALDRIRDVQPTLILTDLRMPKLDGIELIRRLRQMPGLLNVPMIVCTADLVEQIEVQAREAGATAVIAKPVDIPALAELLEQWQRLPPTGKKEEHSG